MLMHSYQCNQSIVVALDGEMDASSVPSIHPEFNYLVEYGLNDVILDFSRVSFLDSSGIGACVFLFKRMKCQNRSLSIIGANGQPLELIKLLRIDRAIPMYEELNELIRQTPSLIDNSNTATAP